MRSLRRVLLASSLAAGLATTALVNSAPAMTVHVRSTPAVRHDVAVSFRAAKLPGGGYYYAVIVLQPRRPYSPSTELRCSTSSNMQRTDYGTPRSDGVVALALRPARSGSGHWCRGGSYEGAIYAVPHLPPCGSAYPCRSEPYEAPCAGVRPGCVPGVVARPGEWSYPEPLPKPLASGTRIVGRFSVRFPAK